VSKGKIKVVVDLIIHRQDLERGTALLSLRLLGVWMRRVEIRRDPQGARVHFPARWATAVSDAGKSKSSLEQVILSVYQKALTMTDDAQLATRRPA
jgi:hypothetical protein